MSGTEKMAASGVQGNAALGAGTEMGAAPGGETTLLHYLDNASTTQPAPQVLARMAQVQQSCWANPSALYRTGLDAENSILEARKVLAKAFGAPAPANPSQKGPVYFTAGGTEANNIAILGAAQRRKGWANHLVTTGYEHPSVLAPLRGLAQQGGYSLTQVAPQPGGAVDVQQVVDAVGPKTALVCAMQVNNETGAVLDVAALASLVKKKNPRCFVHVDGVQGFCKVPLNLVGTEIDSYAVSAHKLHGPKGVGALYLRQAGQIVPPFGGGGQEGGVRPGTENTAGIAGLATAVQLALAARAQTAETIATLRTRLLEGLQAIPGITLHIPPGGYPGILMFSMAEGLRSQPILNALDATYNVCISSGSACDAGAPSHTLAAMGVPQKQVNAALRVSFCGQNTPEDVDALLEGLAWCEKNLAREK